jgi:hypothetical protein
MSEFPSPQQPTGGTGAAPQGGKLRTDPQASGNEVNANLPRARPEVGAAEADDAARITTGGTTCEGPLVGDGSGTTKRRQ